MKIAVLLKSVPDTASVLEISSDGRSLVTDRLEYIMNPYDEYALEEAVRLKESASGEVVAVSLGDGENSRKALRAALAVGADRALLVKAPADGALSSCAAAKVLAAALAAEAPDLLFAGRKAVDDNACQVPERVAELLGISHASEVTRFALDACRARVDREVEDGHLVVESPLPALFTVQKGINTPRYPTLPAILKAKKMEFTELCAADLGLTEKDLAAGVAVESLSLVRQKRKGKILEGETAVQVQSLIALLQQETLV